MTRLEPGQEISARYRLIQRIGSGGMAEVWCADDAMLGRRVALKFLHDRFAQDEHFIERFRREASSAAGLQHPNVVGVSIAASTRACTTSRWSTWTERRSKS